MNIVELSTGRTVHLFDGDQSLRRIVLRSLCGREYGPSRRLAPVNGEPVCVTCINAENAMDDYPTFCETCGEPRNNAELAYVDNAWVCGGCRERGNR